MRDGGKLLLVRHGNHNWLYPPISRLAGRLPGVHINEQGREEAEALGRRLAASPPDRIAASPLERTLETATIIGTHVGRPVVTDDRLIETAMGAWEGMHVPEIIARYPDQWRAWRAVPTSVVVPGLEPVGAIAERMLAAATDYLKEGGVALLVSHQDPLLALVCRLLDLPLDTMRRLDISPGSLTTFEVAGGRPVLVALNSKSRGTACPT